MSFLNPVVVAVVVLCVLCLMKLNVLLSMLIALFAGGLVGGLTIMETMGALLEGFGSNGETALAYVLLGTFATAMAYTGITDVLSVKLAKVVSGKRMVLLLMLAAIACLSQNAVPIHIAFIPILVPPLLLTMNKLMIDRRGAACALAFGLKAPYITLPVGFGLIFQGIIADNMTSNGMPVTVSNIVSVNWILGLAMAVGLAFALLISYRKPREYKDIDVAEVEVGDVRFEKRHWITVVAIFVMVGLQLWFK
ncbi:MAG: SLC13 family permease [Eubacterium sp.]